MWEWRGPKLCTPQHGRGEYVRGTRITALATLAMLNVFTLAAGVTVARMLPPRLAALHIPVAATRPVVRAGTVLAPAGTAAAPAVPTAAGLSALVGAMLPDTQVGPQLGVEV